MKKYALTLLLCLLSCCASAQTLVRPAQGGTGVANNNTATITRSGNHALTLTTTGTTGLTLPTSGTLSTVGGNETLTNKTLAGPTITSATVGTGFNDSITFPTAVANQNFYFGTLGNTFNGTYDPISVWGYNIGRTNTSEPRLQLDMEAHYNNGSGGHAMEMNLDYTGSDGVTGNRRFLSFGVDRITHVGYWGLHGDTLYITTSPNAGGFIFTPRSDKYVNFQYDGPGNKFVIGGPGGSAAADDFVIGPNASANTADGLTINKSGLVTLSGSLLVNGATTLTGLNTINANVAHYSNAGANYLRMFNTAAGNANSENVIAGWSSNFFYFGTTKSGTGTVRDMVIQSDGGKLTVGCNTSAAGQLMICGSAQLQFTGAGGGSGYMGLNIGGNGATDLTMYANGPLSFWPGGAESIRFQSSGNVTIGTTLTDAGFKLDVQGTGRFTGNLTAGSQFIISASSSPLSGAACTAGQHTWDASFGYICTASGAWKRYALTGGY